MLFWKKIDINSNFGQCIKKIISYPVFDNPKFNRTYDSDIQWFSPFDLTSIDDLNDIPVFWKNLALNIPNIECWNCGYTYLHIPSSMYIRDFNFELANGIFAINPIRGKPLTLADLDDENLYFDLYSVDNEFDDLNISTDDLIKIQRLKDRIEAYNCK